MGTTRDLNSLYIVGNLMLLLRTVLSTLAIAAVDVASVVWMTEIQPLY